MQKDILADLVSTIEKDCKDNNIEIFYGSIDENDSCPVHHVELDSPDWGQYLKMLKALEARVIVISVEKNNIENFDEIKAQAQSTEDDEERERLNHAIKRVEKTTGEAATITINFIHGSFQYEFFKHSEWYWDYCLVDTVADQDDDDDDDDPESSEEEYSEQQVEELARTLVSRPAIAKAANARERRNVLFAMPEIDAVKPWSFRTRVIARAEEIFMEEIYPKQEADLNKKVHDKKKLGYKKVQVKGLLNISDNTINRHWYHELAGA